MDVTFWPALMRLKEHSLSLLFSSDVAIFEGRRLMDTTDPGEKVLLCLRFLFGWLVTSSHGDEIEKEKTK